MKKLILIAFIILSPSSSTAQEIYSININRLCSSIVDIQYASDSFSDDEWEKFTNCLKYVKNI